MLDLSDAHKKVALTVIIGIAIFWITAPFIVDFTVDGFTAEVLDRKETWNNYGKPQYFLTIQTIDEIKDIEINVEEFRSGKYEINSDYIKVDTFDFGKLLFMFMLSCLIYAIVFLGGFIIFPRSNYLYQR